MMKILEAKKIIFYLALAFVFVARSQEEIGPLMGNPILQKEVLKIEKSEETTFDSTFIYTLDTISLPIFDDFSKNKFQEYNANYTDPGVTFDKKYKLLDVGGTPLLANVQYVTIETFKRIVDLAAGTTTDIPFSPISIQIGDLSSYPVVYTTTNVYPPYYIYDTVDFPNPIDTVWITPDVVQDSAVQFFAPINDPEKIWADSYVYHNYTLAKFPWSLGVASFDGLDENGFPYQFGTTLTGYADVLTSKPIDLSSVSASDSVYFSFLYQAEGFGDVPESSDSLILEFYEKDLDQWNWIWSTTGSSMSDFKHVHIRIDNPVYFKKGFRFRFRNYGGLSGSLDHFHVDYVNLRTLSGYQDTIIHDFAIVYPVNFLLDTYSSVPWDHYKNNPTGKMSSSVEVVVRNSDNVPENEQNGTTEIQYGGITEQTFILQDYLLNNGDLNYSPLTTYISYHDFSTGGRFDETKPGIQQEFDIVTGITHLNSVFTQNDSSYTKQKFVNYYSYDDGTAEAAYGPTGVQAKLAIKYTPYEADSVIGVRIHFVPSVYDVSDKLFLVTLWGDNNGEPGEVLYQDELFFPRQPKYEYDRNIFTTYYFKDTMKVRVDGTFYIGWQQFDQDRLNVGLDRNRINNDKTYYNVDGVNWLQSSIPGSVMIHPVFSTSYDAVLGLRAKEGTNVFNVYPNPVTNILKIKSEEVVDKVEVYDMMGQKVKEEKNVTTIHFYDVPKGVYFIKINDAKPIKIIKQ